MGKLFTDKAEALLERARNDASARQQPKLELDAVQTALVRHPESARLLTDLLGTGPEQLQEGNGALPEPVRAPGRLPAGKAVRSLLRTARQLAEAVPDNHAPGLIDLRHLAGAAATSTEACHHWDRPSLSEEAVREKLRAWYERDLQAPALNELTERLRGLRDELLAKVFGQDHAVHAFVEGLFNAEVVAAADTSRRQPRALFVFAGPPGVGKTYLAGLGAAALDRPFKRFDMSGYAGHQQHEQLVGMAKAYRGAHAGSLTEFVEQNPDAVLLFDEIEKANLRTIHLFLQVLDAGTLEDKFHEREVSFRDTTIIFTTNAGRKLYDDPDAAGVQAAGSNFHRRTILNALETEKNPETGEPFFPAALCSRLATGYPVLFNHLGINELERVAATELERVGELIERQFCKPVDFDDLVPMGLVLREGARVDARTLRSQAENFVKTEVFNVCQLFEGGRLEEVLQSVDRFRFRVERSESDEDPRLAALFAPPEKPKVLLVAEPALANVYEDTIGAVDWWLAFSREDVLEVLGREEIDLVVLDIWLGHTEAPRTKTAGQFDHVPLAASGLQEGQEILRSIHERFPGTPVYLLSVEAAPGDGQTAPIDEELLTACMRAGGARGVFRSRFIDVSGSDWQDHRERFTADLLEAAGKVLREKTAARLGQERQVLAFETAPAVDEDCREITFRLRHLRLNRALAAADAGEMLDDVERPRIGFADVIGAEAAKEELRFFIDYLKNPRRFAALGLKVPKGVLLHGPPGTGKTLLARAMAGESDLAFIPASASNFVTMWQGSGPQNIRDLFARARRYAPAVIFVDEIDAVGKTRTGGPGNKAEENTLNALLTEMDGFTSPAPHRPVFVLAATNFGVDSDEQDGPQQSAQTLDAALVRRFDRKILVDLPDRSARKRYLNMRLENRPNCAVSDEIIDLVAERSSRMSIANLEAVLETAMRNAVRAGSPLTGELLEEALETTQFGEARPRSHEEKLRTARHEAGHTLLYWLAGWWASYVTIVARGGHGGYMAPAAEESEQGGFTREQLEAKIRVMLGGRAAETFYYGTDAGVTTGASSDLERASSLARQMVGRFGMDDDFGLLAVPELMQSEQALGSPLYQRLSEAAGRILTEQMEQTAEALGENREFLDALVEALVEQERLTREELQQILPALDSTARAQTR